IVSVRKRRISTPHPARFTFGKEAFPALTGIALALLRKLRTSSPVEVGGHVQAGPTAHRDRWLYLLNQGNLMFGDRTNRPLWLRFTVSVLVAAVAAAIRLQFFEILEFRSPFLTFYPAVAVAALYGGLEAGLLATVV